MAASIEQVNMTEGALLPKVLRFSLPLAATGVLQLLFKIEIKYLNLIINIDMKTQN